MRKPGPYYTQTIKQDDMTVIFFFTGRLRRYKWKIAFWLLRLILWLSEADYTADVHDAKKGSQVETIWPRHIG